MKKKKTFSPSFVSISSAQAYERLKKKFSHYFVAYLHGNVQVFFFLL